MLNGKYGAANATMTSPQDRSFRVLQLSYSVSLYFILQDSNTHELHRVVVIYVSKGMTNWIQF